MRPIAFATFFALVGATIDLHILWPVPNEIYQILAIQILAVLFFRALLPSIWTPFGAAALSSQKHIGWLLLPKGALLFELIYHRNSLVDLVQNHWGQLLHQVFLTDIPDLIKYFRSRPGPKSRRYREVPIVQKPGAVYI